MKELLDRALTVLALGLLMMIIDAASAASGRIGAEAAFVVFGLDLVLVGAAAVLALIGFLEQREAEPSSS